MKKYLNQKKLYLLLCIIIALLLSFFDIGCPFYYFLHIPCPTCGVTRALLALLRLDFKAYFNYNAMALGLLIAFFMLVIPSNKNKWVNGIAISILILNFIYYFFRISNL